MTIYRIRPRHEAESRRLITTRYAPYNKALLIESSHTDQAIAILRHIVGADPKAATAYLHLGQALEKKGRDGEAEDAFGRAVRADRSLQQFVPEQFRDSASAAPTATELRQPS
ncbi:tetratricopeptide repeat protein [Streptomyces sp. LN590]|uniref:tetratricopeptide repeat protein n=1 Tax=Streptomyces sp. LN590 TaxID=3112980 RepID=UPI003719BB5A